MAEFDIGYPHSKVKRIVNNNSRTISNRIIAYSLGKEYYDGARENGYGGFYYDGRWKEIVPRIIDRYNLTSKSAVLDVGCKKGFFLHDLKDALPDIKIQGIENHTYPLDNAMASIKPFLNLSQYESLPYKNNEYDFIMAFASIYMLNLGGVLNALKEIQRVGKGKSYVTLGAYETKEERNFLLDWTLIGTTILHVDEWLEVFKDTGYTGDYYFTTPTALGLVIK